MGSGRRERGEPEGGVGETGTLMLKDPSIQLGLKANVKGEMRAEIKACKRSERHLRSFKFVKGARCV